MIGKASSSETRQARWVTLDSLSELNIHPSMPLRINHALTQGPGPYLG